MPNEDYTAVVLDASGSMSSRRDETIRGYDKFISQQKEMDEGRMTLTRTIFSDSPGKQDSIDTTHHDLSETCSIEGDYNPEGTTPLYDAIGATIDEMGAKFEAMDEDEKPSEVMVAIVTDGKENASVEYGLSDVQSLIQQQEEEWGWTFIFIGASLDDFSDARDMDISKDRMSGADDPLEAYDQVATASANLRMDGSVGDYQEGGTLDENCG
jgi:hypothetical protein